MKIVKFNCSGCGAELDIPKDELGVYKCKYCGEENFIRDNYEVEYVPTHGEKDIRIVIEELKDHAKHLLNNKSYEEAYSKYLEVYEYLPRDLEILEGLMRSLSFDFNPDEINISFDQFRFTFDEYLDIYKENQTDDIKVQFFNEKYITVCNKVFLKSLGKTIVGAFFFILVITVFIASVVG